MYVALQQVATHQVILLGWGNLVAWIPFQRPKPGVITVKGSEEFCEKLLKEENVAVVPGSAFGKSGDKHVRISYCYSVEELKEAMTRIARFVDKLRSEEKDKAKER